MNTMKLSGMDSETIRTKAAESDLRQAVKYGEVLIGQTTKGTVKVTHQGNGFYWITLQGSPDKAPEILMATARKAQALKVLAPLYIIEFGA